MQREEPQLLNVQKAASFLGTSTNTIRLCAQKNKLKGVKEFARNIDIDIKKGTEVFKKIGERIAKDAIKDGLTIEEAIDGILFLKQAFWKVLDSQGLLPKFELEDVYHFNQTIGTYCDVI